RSARLNTQLQQELSALLRQDVLRDPRLYQAILTITAVEVSPDLGNARVRVSWLGEDRRLEECVAALNHATGKLRHELGLRLRLRHVPTLRFVADTALREGDRIGGLIRAAVQEDRQHAIERGDDES
ncbi:MAG: 30S ribosome-binding factor RbfA, partial [Sinobacteraceae bacterium]|nr:30S ribosome-binding factor RbfA [Nevskiaceae bacterium]